MGSGASKNQKRTHDGGGPSTPLRVSPIKLQTNETPSHKNGESLKKPGRLPFQNKIPTSLLNTDSDSDGDFDSASVQVTDRELEDLESSLMGIPSLKDTSPNKEEKGSSSRTHDNNSNSQGDENLSILSSPTQGSVPHPQCDSFYEFARKRPKRTGDVRRTSSLGRSSQFTSNRRPYQRSVEDPQRLRFSWDDRKTSSATAVTSLDRDDEEEWTYKKSVIDGFDVAKFKKVNSKVGEPSSTFMDKHTGRKGLLETQMPGVPTYDTVEQQLLASLEREILLK